jgi:hypothetical protein
LVADSGTTGDEAFGQEDAVAAVIEDEAEFEGFFYFQEIVFPDAGGHGAKVGEMEWVEGVGTKEVLFSILPQNTVLVLVSYHIKIYINRLQPGYTVPDYLLLVVKTIIICAP